MRKSHEAREKLLRLGIFRQVEVLIDTCQGKYCSTVSYDFSFIFPLYIARARERGNKLLSVFIIQISSSVVIETGARLKIQLNTCSVLYWKYLVEPIKLASFELLFITLTLKPYAVPVTPYIRNNITFFIHSTFLW